MGGQVPGKPNYNTVFYFSADRPLKPGSLLQRFADGSDSFRNARFKLIPRIVEVRIYYILYYYL